MRDSEHQRKRLLLSYLAKGFTPEMVKRGEESNGYDIKLVVNGFECSPSVLYHIYTNLNEFIQEEAQGYLKDRLEDRFNSVSEDLLYLESVIGGVKNKIADEFGVELGV